MIICFRRRDFVWEFVQLFNYPPLSAIREPLKQLNPDVWLFHVCCHWYGFPQAQKWKNYSGYETNSSLQIWLVTEYTQKITFVQFLD